MRQAGGGTEKERRQLNRNRPNTMLLAIMLLAAIWLVAMAVAIYRTNVQQAGIKALVMLGVAGLFLGGWALAYWSWVRREARK